MSKLPRPAPSEYNEYYRRYIDLVPDGDVVETLERQIHDTLAPLALVAEEEETRRYAPGKWSLREVVGHAIDTERMFGYRALAMAREDGVVLPGMDQDDWARHSNANHRPLPELTREWEAVPPCISSRASTT